MNSNSLASHMLCHNVQTDYDAELTLHVADLKLTHQYLNTSTDQAWLLPVGRCLPEVPKQRACARR